MNETIVKVENLVKRYKEILALDHFNLDIKKGEIFGLLGPNGSGKTTAINCILSLLSYDKGNIELFGKQMKPDSYDMKRDIGIIMQNVAVFEELSVYENIDYFCGLYVRNKKERSKRIAIIDKGQNLAIGTNEELKNMIKIGEIIRIEILELEQKALQEIKELPHIFAVFYEEHVLKIQCSGGKHNLIRVMNYLQEHDISFGRVLTELPTLNDVFLEITGKALRD